MNILMYIAYGDNPVYWRELQFSILTAWYYIRDDVSTWKIVVCTDQPHKLEGYPVTIRLLDASKLHEWFGPDSYKHRLKNRAMAEVMDEYASPIAAMDTDTYFKKSPRLIFDKLAPGRSVMHKRESRIADKRGELWKYVQNLKLEDPWGGTYTFPPDSQMWNSGVVGLHPDDRPLLDRALWLLDTLYGLTKIFNIEQYTLGEVLRRESALIECHDIVEHYWGSLRPLFHWKLERFFYERSEASFDSLATDTVTVRRRTFSLAERIIVRFKGDLFGWSSDYRRACLLLREGTAKPRTFDPEENFRAFLRGQALTALKKELAACEALLASGKVSTAQLRKKVARWRKDLAGASDPGGFAMLPQTERKEWVKFWKKVDDLLASC